MNKASQRVCKNCHEIKDSEKDFHSYRPGTCKKCHSDQSRESKKKTIVKRLAQGADKECSKCGLIKPLSDYYKNSASNYCKSCHNTQSGECRKLRRRKLKDIESKYLQLKDENQKQQLALIESLQEQVRLLKLQIREDDKNGI